MTPPDTSSAISLIVGGRLFPRRHRLCNKWVVITGGSEGLGKALAHDALRRGARRVTLLARTAAKLQAACDDLRAGISDRTDVSVDYQCCDVTDAAAVAHVFAHLCREEEEEDIPPPKPERKSRPRKTRATSPTPTPTPTPARAPGCGRRRRRRRRPDIVICNAGSAHPGYFTDIHPDVHRKAMQTNYLGVVHVIHAVTSIASTTSMKDGDGDDDDDSSSSSSSNHHHTHFVLVSSAMGLMGFSGYSAYAPSKHALRGLADCLQNEWSSSPTSPFSVSISFPVDMDTEGYRVELEKTPRCTRLISQLGSVVSPELAAAAVLRGVEGGRFHLPSTDGMNDLLAHGVSGIGPKDGCPSLLVETFLVGPLLGVATRVVGLFAALAVRWRGWRRA